jgi:hypothetical protein
MGDFVINWWAILVATAASFAIGSVWYGPMFGKAWMAGMGLSEEQVKQLNAAKAYGVTFVLGIVLAYSFSVIVNYVEAWKGGALTWTDGLMGGFFVWLGFIFTVKVSDAMFGQVRMSAVVIDSGYRLVWMLVTGVIIAVWR